MNCDEFKSSFYGYLEDQLDAEDRARFEAHRDACAACSELFAVGTELTCRDFIGFLDDFVEGRFKPERQAVFERHLSVCPDCTAYLESYRRTMALVRAALEAPDGQVPGGLPEHLVQAILTTRRREP